MKLTNLKQNGQTENKTKTKLEIKHEQSNINRKIKDGNQAETT